MEGDTELGLVVKNALDALELPVCSTLEPAWVLRAKPLCHQRLPAPHLFGNRGCRAPA